jgi:hypothetical protein
MSEAIAVQVIDSQMPVFVRVQEAVNIAYRLGFAQKSPGSFEDLKNPTLLQQAQTLLNNHALYCWNCDPD